MITEKHFIDWESDVFGFGYGTGEQHTILALWQTFMLMDKGHYSYTDFEDVLGPAAAWLMINTLCHADIIEYGTSARYGWLTPKGKLLAEFVVAHTADQLVEMVTGKPDDYVHCLPDYCNCTGEKCNNPLWPSSASAAGGKYGRSR